MFGKVAKGFFGSEQGVDNTSSEVEKLLGTAADGVLVQDKREALALLSELLQSSEQAKKIVGMTGLPVLCGILGSERDDTEMLRGALECLTVATALPSSRDRQSAGAMNAELFARGPENVPLLLGLLEGIRDFYVRYHTVQLLTALSAGDAHRLAEAVLAAPQGVVKLMDLLVDGHEVVRNEALLLLVGLSHASAQIKQIAVFEGAFERLLGIIKDEEGIYGGIVVQDCFELLNNLLRNDAANQLMFRESGHLRQLPALLKLPESHFNRGLPSQRATNILCLLDTFIVLLIHTPQQANGHQPAVPGAEPQRLQNAAALLELGLLEKLLMLSLKGTDPSAQSVRNQGLLCLAHLISEHPNGQERLVMSGLGWLGGTPALRQILRISLHTRDPAEHMAARSVIRAFCRKNLEGQSMLTATIVPVADPHPGNTTFGGELVKALRQPDLVVSSRAAAVLTCMIDENPSTKQRLLTIPLDLSTTPGTPPTLLMTHCITQLSNAIYSPGRDDQCAAVILLKLLVTWFSDNGQAVAAFQELPSNVPFIVDIVTGRKGVDSPLVSGLAALVLGVCLITQQGERSSMGVLDSITTKVGLAKFFERLEGLYGDDSFRAALSSPKASRPALRTSPSIVDDEEEGRNGQAAQLQHIAENQFDHAFAKRALDLQPRIREAVISGEPGTANRSAVSRQLQDPKGPQTNADHLQEAQSTIQSLEREMDSLRMRNRALSQQAMVYQTPRGEAMPASLGSQGAALEQSRAIQEAERRASAAQAECDNYRHQLSRLQEKLHEAAQSQIHLEQKLKEAIRDAEEAQAAATKYEAELEALSSAYTDLENHAHSLEAELHNQGQDDLPTSSGKADADGEDDDQLNDLLACLGEEEQKVERLQEKLRQLGVDPGPLLEDISQAEEGSNESDGEREAQDFT